jgi:hypothetical protein
MVTVTLVISCSPGSALSPGTDLRPVLIDGT